MGNAVGDGARLAVGPTGTVAPGGDPATLAVAVADPAERLASGAEPLSDWQANVKATLAASASVQNRGPRWPLRGSIHSLHVPERFCQLFRALKLYPVPVNGADGYTPVLANQPVDVLL